MTSSELLAVLGSLGTDMKCRYCSFRDNSELSLRNHLSIAHPVERKRDLALLREDLAGNFAKERSLRDRGWNLMGPHELTRVVI
jgi:hypothetical protein